MLVCLLHVPHIKFSSFIYGSLELTPHCLLLLLIVTLELWCQDIDHLCPEATNIGIHWGIYITKGEEWESTISKQFIQSLTFFPVYSLILTEHTLSKVPYSQEGAQLKLITCFLRRIFLDAVVNFISKAFEIFYWVRSISRSSGTSDIEGTCKILWQSIQNILSIV